MLSLKGGIAGAEQALVPCRRLLTGRFLHVGKQQPFSNRNLEVYSIDGSGGLSLRERPPHRFRGAWSAPWRSSPSPQGQFVYAVDQNANLIPFQLAPSTGALTPGDPGART